jgi:nicotinate-nucleotide adenylyltransferase
VPILPPFGDRRRQRIGILGGSFNPAHAGHLHISREALRRLNLDQVWWLVSPQNPLKSKRNMASLRHRMIAAKFVAKDSRILVTDLEQRLGSTRTAITLQHLCARYPNIQFIWLMGADNLSEVPRWWRWTGVFSAVRVAIFDRSPYSFPALAGQAASRFARFRARRPTSIWLRSPPHWTYIATCRHPASATTLRAIDHSGRPTE